MHRPSEELDSAFEEMCSKEIDAVIIQPTLLQPRAVKLALKYRLPSSSIDKQLPATGGLLPTRPTTSARPRSSST
jgi:hypothetical protein